MKVPEIVCRHEPNGTMRTNLTRLLTPLFSLLLLVSTGAPGRAQTNSAPGRVMGRVLDAGTRQGVAAVAVYIVGTNVSAISAADGRFILPNVPAGRLLLQATSLGYAPRSVPVEVRSAAVTEQNIELAMEAVAVEALEVSVAGRRGSVERALQDQRDAVGLMNTVTAEQISRSPDGDAAQAIQRMSGATVQDGKFVIVRGLGERYTTTSLNGARVPSAEPERKLVPLDLFPSVLLERITTAKTFTPDQPGDFSGASVDIRTRDFPVRGLRSLSLSFGYNPAVTGKFVSLAPAAGTDWLALGAGARGRPASAGAQLADFRNVWSPENGRAVPNAGFGFTLGGNRQSPTRQLGYVFSGTYANAREVRADEVRAQAQAAGDSTMEIDRYTGSTTRQSVSWGGIANLSALLSGRSRLALNNTYNRSADNEARLESGTSENYGNLPLDITRLRYVERAVRSHQLTGEHELDDRHAVDWSISTAAVTRREPDRSEIVYARNSDPQSGAVLPPAWFANAAEGAVRTYGDLAERSWEVAANARRKIAESSKLKLGALARTTDRATQNAAYSITAPLLPQSERVLAPEEIFAASDARFRTAPLAQGGSYDASDRLLAGYALFDWQASDRLRISLGARLEHSAVRVRAEPTVGTAIETSPVFTDVLPSLAINYQSGERQVLKFSASQTLSRPEYRELAGVQYREV
ncbi:MAG TPA: TonB-dependent receptor, partial [Vicinamibacterales bacterium]|nr:TonB-dependent receptor [Vicinamibacterales bacterium]